MCASAILPVTIGSSCVTSVCGSWLPCSNSTSMPARNCSRSNRSQSMPIASPTRLASSVVVLRCSVMGSESTAARQASRLVGGISGQGAVSGGSRPVRLRLRSDRDSAEKGSPSEGEYRRIRVALRRRPGVDPTGEGLQFGFDAPAWRCLDCDPAEQRVERQPCAGGEFDLAEIDIDTAVPRQHRASSERLGPALERDAVEDSDEANVVALFVALRGDSPPDKRGSSHHPRPGPELEEEHSSKRTHRPQAYKGAAVFRASPAWAGGCGANLCEWRWRRDRLGDIRARSRVWRIRVA